MTIQGLLKETVNYEKEVETSTVIENIPENISDGEYTLIVSELVGSSKADQPLGLTGTWECSFRKQYKKF